MHTFALGAIFTANRPDLTVRRWAHEVDRILVAENPTPRDGELVFDGMFQ